MNLLSLISPWLDIICQVITKYGTIPKPTTFHQQHYLIFLICNTDRSINGYTTYSFQESQLNRWWGCSSPSSTLWSLQRPCSPPSSACLSLLVVAACLLTTDGRSCFCLINFLETQGRTEKKETVLICGRMHDDYVVQDSRRMHRGTSYGTTSTCVRSLSCLQLWQQAASRSEN